MSSPRSGTGWSASPTTGVQAPEQPQGPTSRSRPSSRRQLGKLNEEHAALSAAPDQGGRPAGQRAGGRPAPAGALRPQQGPHLLPPETDGIGYASAWPR